MPLRSLTAAAFALLTLLLLGCQQTKLTAVWEADEQASDGYRRLMILALTDNVDVRRTFEYEFAVQLGRKHLDAVPSLEILEPGDEPVRGVIQPKLEGSGVDAVLAVRLTGTDSGAAPEVTREDLGFYGYYGRYHTVQAANYSTLNLESSLYDAKSAELMWRATSATFDPTGIKIVARSLAASVIEDLTTRGLLVGAPAP